MCLDTWLLLLLFYVKRFLYWLGVGEGIPKRQRVRAQRNYVTQATFLILQYSKMSVKS